jgi:pyridoxine/pyridoxamine 5'-phosphate oxidase
MIGNAAVALDAVTTYWQRRPKQSMRLSRLATWFSTKSQPVRAAWV